MKSKAPIRLNHDALLELIENEQKITYRGAHPSFRDIAAETGTMPSTFTRLRARKSMSADALLRIIDWLARRHCDVEAVFIHISQPESAPKRNGRKAG